MSKTSREFPKNAIEDHERMALFALVSVSILAAFSLFAFLKYQGLNLLRRRVSGEARLLSGEAANSRVSVIPAWALLTTLVLGAASAGILGYTGKLGSKIRHVDFYGGAPAEDEDENDRRDRRGRDRTQNETAPSTNSNAAAQLPRPTRKPKKLKSGIDETIDVADVAAGSVSEVDIGGTINELEKRSLNNLDGRYCIGRPPDRCVMHPIE